MRFIQRHRPRSHLGRWTLMALVCAAPAQGQTAEELQRELNDMKQQMQQLQERMRKQEELIDKLSAPAPTPTTGSEVAAMPPTPAAEAKTPESWSLAAPIRLFGIGGAYMNISFDVLADAGWSTHRDVSDLEVGDHDPLQRGFTIPNAEVVFDGAVDPYFKAVGNVVFKLDQDGETDVELEEAYLLTTSLPWNLQAKAGQQLVEFGRFNPQHPHQWEFVDQNLINNRMFGPEGLRSAGGRLSWLTPTPFYSELMLAVLNSSGGTNFSFRNSEEELFGRPGDDRGVRNLGDLLYVPRYVTAFDLSDEQTLVLGLSGAFGPNASGDSTDSQIYGADVFWKWKPVWQSEGFPFVTFQTEAMGRRYEAGAADLDADGDGVPDSTLPRENLYDWGFYSQATYGFTQRWVTGLRGEWVSGDEGAFDPDPNRDDRFRFSPVLTYYPTEFSKIRLQYNFDHGQQHGDDSSVWLQLELLLGSHGAHKF